METIKKQNKTKPKLSVICSILVCIAIMFVSTGFSSLENKLSATNIGAEVRVNADIRITNLTIDNLSNGAISVGEDYNKTNIFSEINLPNENSEIIYNVTITNMGNVEMGIGKITGLDSNLEYELLDIQEGKDRICEGSTCTKGATKTVKLKIKYKDGKYDSNNTIYNLNAIFDFRYFLKVQYNETINEYKDELNPLSVMYGNDVVATFDCSSYRIRVYINGKIYSVGEEFINPEGTITSIEKIDNNIVVRNVTDNIEFSYEDEKQVTTEEEITKYGLKLKATWYDDNTVKFNLNGTLTTTIYTRLREKDILMSDIPSSLYKEEYAENPLFKAGDEIFLKYTYLGGDISTITQTITFKFRDTTTESLALNNAEYIANHTKQNFKLDESTIKTSELTTNVSELSLFAKAGSTFNDYTFTLEYGYTKDLQ